MLKTGIPQVVHQYQLSWGLNELPSGFVTEPWRPEREPEGAPANDRYCPATPSNVIDAGVPLVSAALYTPWFAARVADTLLSDAVKEPVP